MKRSKETRRRLRVARQGWVAIKRSRDRGEVTRFWFLVMKSQRPAVRESCLYHHNILKRIKK